MAYIQNPIITVANGICKAQAVTTSAVTLSPLSFVPHGTSVNTYIDQGNPTMTTTLVADQIKLNKKPNVYAIYELIVLDLSKTDEPNHERIVFIELNGCIELTPSQNIRDAVLLKKSADIVQACGRKGIDVGSVDIHISVKNSWNINQ